MTDDSGNQQKTSMTSLEERLGMPLSNQNGLPTQESALAASISAAAPGPTEPIELPPLDRWAAQLAREAAAGRGIDALRLILTEIKDQYGDDEPKLLDAIQQINECAHRHLDPQYEYETIEVLFDGIFGTAPADVDDALDTLTINHDVTAEIQRLAGLPNIQYERERKVVAERLGIRTSALDDAVKAARPQDSKGQGRPFELPSIDPWPSPIDGTELLGELCTTIGAHIVLPSDSLETLALWAVHTHCFDCFAISPRAAITSPEKGCGKTTTLDVLACLVSRPLQTSNATVSTIFRIIEIAKPTLLIDEADTFLGENDELRGILNSGHRRGGQILRTVGDDHEPRQFSTWAPVAIAMIGRLPDTLNDRSVIVSLRRRKPSERITSFRSDRSEHLMVLARKMARWAADNQHQLTNSDPYMGELNNRTADNWRPLFAIADQCGGKWPARVREVASKAVKAAVEQSFKVQLLEDIRTVFEGGAAILDRIASKELVDRLTAMDGRPWAEWKGGKPLTQNTLSPLLRPFEILSGTIRLQGGQTAKGYYRSAFEDAFSRYLPSQSVTASQINNHGHCNAFQNVTPERPVTLSKASQLNNHGDCDGVTFPNPRLPRMGAIDL